MEEEEHIAGVIKKYMEGGMTPAEQAELHELLLAGQDNQIVDHILTLMDKEQEQSPLAEEEITGILRNIFTLDQIEKPVLHIRHNRFPLIAAASVAILLSIGFFFYQSINSKRQAEQALQIAKSKNTIIPGSNKATLKLQNGQLIELNDKPQGEIASIAGVSIRKDKNGQLVYQVSNNTEKESQGINTISTPKGGQYQIILADGTKVWLNAMSKLSYPTSFKGNKREVTLEGEAYFDVKKNTAQPFLVNSNGQQIEVLGTHFNVNAYADEDDVKTTLIEGSVRLTTLNKQQKINRNSKIATLVPGQQAITNTTGKLSLQAADMEQAIAWKNGEFSFSGRRVDEVMRQIARWYDVDIEYRTDVSNKELMGSVSRFKDIREVLRKLEYTSVIHFKIEGRRIIVTE
ncbi:FecR family protein [Pedobacter nyackensis]|uniref:FecR family protein n=1 Tax=Pedobacter nyackensis TaxID=475255 RepID=UPI0029308E34|nr:FecR domain-containing protein [Pedobacter nyackensis]